MTPTNGATISGNIYQTSACEVRGSNIDRVRFYIGSTALNTEENGPWNCNLDTRKYADGTYTLRAVAYDSAGATASTQISVNIKNSTTTTSTTTTTTSTGPSVSWYAPAEGALLKGIYDSSSACQVNGTGIAKVIFHLDGTQLNTEGVAPWQCIFDTRKFADGAHTLKAVAYNSSGASTTLTRAVTIQNGTTATPAPTPTADPTAPTVSWSMPAEGGVLKGNVQGPPNCVVTGTNVARVMFYINDVWTNTDGNLSNGLGCWIDTTKYKDGAYTLKAVAYNSAGKASAPVTRGIVIQNAATAPANTAPTVSITTPAAGATLSGTVPCSADATDNVSVVSVKFSIGSTVLATDTAAPYTCSIDTKAFANGTYALMATATDGQGASATAQRSVTVQNTITATPTPTGTASSVDAADIIGWASGDSAFSEQKGYTAQVLGTYTSASSIPDAGIHGTALSNGETLRLGKDSDPLDSTRKALAFQLAYSDPTTSGSKRSELSFNPTVEMDKVYWVAFRVNVRDWSSESSSGLFGTQMHSGNNSLGLSPSFGIYMSGATGFRVETRYSTSSSPSPSNSVTIKHGDHPIPFGRWMDVVIKFKQNTSGAGFLQAWVDGNQIVNYQGNLGFNTPGYKDYAKFGLYNWGSFSNPRKVLMRSPIVVQDSTGSKYDAATLRAQVNK